MDLLVSSPPYRDFGSIPRLPSLLPEGSVLGFRMAAAPFGRNGDPLLGWLRQVRRVHAGTLLVMFLDSDTGLDGATLARRLADVGVRIVLPGDPSVPRLRAALNVAGIFHVDVAAWLRVRLGPTTPTGLAVCESLSFLIGDAVAEQPRLDGLLGLLKRQRLPRLSRWRMLRNVLHPILELQGKPGLAVEAAVVGSPYSERRSFDGACVTLTGLTGRALGGLMGWEGVVDLMFRMETGT